MLRYKSSLTIVSCNININSMPSNPGQNLHLVSSQIHAVASSSHLANSSSQLVVLSSYLVESSSHLVVSSILLTSPLLVYSSVILQLVVSHFNSPFSISVYLSPSSRHAVSRYKSPCFPIMADQPNLKKRIRIS